MKTIDDYSSTWPQWVRCVIGVITSTIVIVASPIISLILCIRWENVMYTIWEAIKEFAGGVVICVYGALFHNRLFKRKTVNIKE